MGWSYDSAPSNWIPLVWGAFLVVLGLYAWRHGSVQGARPFAVACLFATLWTAGGALVAASLDPHSAIFWGRFQLAMLIPGVTATQAFVLQYAGLGHWLSRPAVFMLALPPVLGLILILTNNTHHLLWQSLEPEMTLRPLRGPAYWVFIAYGFLVGLANAAVLIRLFIRSPRRRWPAVLMLVGPMAFRGTFVWDAVSSQPLQGIEPAPVALGVTLAAYATALFGFRLREPVNAGRALALKQMHEGVVMLDARQAIVDLNPAAERILGTGAAEVRGKPAADVLPFAASLLRTAGAEAPCSEVVLGTGTATRLYELRLSPLQDDEGVPTGHLILLLDVTR